MSGTEENPAVPAVDASSEEVFRRVRRLQLLTIIWMSLEAAVSLVSAWNAHSPALLAFGGDSLIELLSAVVVLRRFRFRLEEGRAARLAGMLLFVLGALVVVASALDFLGYGEARPSLTGIAILLVAAFLMPWLANRKRKLSSITSSAALRADAAESALCGYMAWIALAGLLPNFLWKKSWADPLAALALIPLIVHEGWEAIMSAKRS